MIQFATPQYLLLILLIPVFFVLYAFYRRGRKKKIAQLGNIEIIEKLMPTRSRAKGWVRLAFFSLAWLFFMVGLARPQIGARIKETQKKGAEIMIALDVSNSMMAQDYSPNRLERAKLAISRLVDKLQGDRIGLIVFAGQSFVQLPITTDYVSAKIFLNSISNESVPVQGTAMGDAITTAVRSFSTDAQMGQNNKAIILITDGENHEDDPVEAAKTAAGVGIKVFCIGVGSADGKPIPINATGELLKDKDGNIVVTKLNEVTLEEVAAAGGGAYIRAGNAEFGLNPIINDLKNMNEGNYKSVVFEDFDEQYMYFFGIALFFFLLEFLVGNRRVGKRMFAILALICFTSLQGFAQTDKKEVRKGNRFYEKKNYKESEVEYRKALLKDSTSVGANYNLANTLYKMEDAANAEKAYGAIADTIGKMKYNTDWEIDKTKTFPSIASDYYHNLGNSYLAQKKYSEAVEAYKNSLRRNPNDMETKANYAYAKKKLDEQQKNQQQNKDKNKDQDQNKDQ
ncbi:MAG: VWA domain-containing protein, partial [Bacteroidales bacterium]